MANTERTREARWPMLALSLATAIVVVLGLCPAIALAEDVEVEPEGTEEPVVVVQGEDSVSEPEGLPVNDVEVIAQDLSAQTIDVDYLDVDGSVKTAKAEAIPNQSPWGTDNAETWYVATGNRIIEQKSITAYGDTRLILADNATLTVRGTIITASNNGRLTIYAQSTDKDRMGKLVVIPPQQEPGGHRGFLGQSLTINGGKVSFTGINTYGIHINGEGVDSQRYASMTINGGEVTAVGGIKVSAHNGAESSLTINGGTVIAEGYGNDYGIWACVTQNGSHANVTINGGTVTASGGGDKSAIGTKGDGTSTIDGTLTIGDGVSVKAGGNEGSAVDVTGKDYAEWGTAKWAQTTVPVTGVTVAPTSATLTVGETKVLTAAIAPDHAVDKTVTWTSSDTGVATVDEKTGEVTAVGAGTATITATANDGSGKSASCAVTVKAKPEPEPIPLVVPDASVTAHVQRIGWMDPVTDGTAAGTTGKSRRMEALALRLPDGVAGGIEYRGHVQRSGWEEAWVADGAQSGTTGKSRRVEAVQVRLTGEAEKAYDVYYRVHVQRIGWMAWAKNGEEAGTQGMSRRAEAIQVVLVKKDAPAPEATYKGVTQQYAKAFVKK
ncbi:MAG: Ig-like domain-containing protein [Coriobacteriales bacterium]|nr:Ig-like domain-containing protein [Coriobacteriales bacterium]